MNDGLDFRVSTLGHGRALYIDRQGALYVSQRYVVRRSDDGGATWHVDCFVPSSGWKPLAAKLRLGARLLRYCIAAFQVLPDGSRVAVARDGIYRVSRGETAMTRVFRYTRGSRPLNLAADGNRVLFGEYGDLNDGEVCIYVSENSGRTFDIGYRFPRGDIRHVHNVLVDPHRDNYWVFVGDFGRQSGIGVLSKDLKSLDWLSRGSQRCRAVGAVVEKDCLVYGTDSDRERNFIVRMDRQSGRIEDLSEVEGSSLYATRFGPVRVISTCVEPNPMCPSRECSLYVSRDGTRWQRLAIHRKDRYHSILFQFGTLVLPHTCHDGRWGVFSGQAVNGLDDRVAIIDFEKSEKLKSH